MHIEAMPPHPTDREWSAIGAYFGWGYRERQVVRLVATGTPRKRAASLLGISLSTLQTHLRRALFKARADGLVELVWLVVEVRDRRFGADDLIASVGFAPPSAALRAT